MTIKYQNYKHYKLPISINPLEYGKLIFKTDNIYIIQITSRTVSVISQYEDFNEVKFFKEGDLAFIYKDHKLDDNTFTRTLNNKKFTFKNNELILIDIHSQKSIILVISVLKPSYNNIKINSTTILIILHK
jgi:hypothetical protein